MRRARPGSRPSAPPRVELWATGLAAALALAHLAGAGTGLLYLAPAILLGALVIGGRYPGAEALARPLARFRARRARAARTAVAGPRPRPARRLHPRGGLLLGSRQAGRGPPPAAPAHPDQSIQEQRPPMKHRLIAAAGAITAAGALALPVAAQAHVTLQPKAQTAGAYTVINVRVPNERDNASTTKVRVEFPDGIYAVSYAAQAGWKAVVKKSALATPVPTDDGPITERVSSVTFTGTGKGLGRIAPGQFKDFPLSLKLPSAAGTLTFPSYQWYSGGELVKWTGPASADLPAPTLVLTAPPVATAAHSPVRSRTPAPGSTASGVKSVAVRFGEAVVTGTIAVTRNGTPVKTRSVGLLSGNKAILRATFAKALPAGTYTVAWRARADDGHSEKGTWSFTARR